MNNSHEVLEKNFKSDIKQFETIPQKILMIYWKSIIHFGKK